MSGLAVEQLWRFALALIPLAALVALLTRLLPFRPSTRHAMWLSVLAMLVVAPVLPRAPVPDLVRLARPSGGADTGADMGMGAGMGMDTGAGAGADTDTGADTGTGAGTGAGADTGTGADTGAGAARANVPTPPAAASDLTSPSLGAGGGVWRGIKIERRHGRRERELAAVEERQDAATSVPEGTTPRSGRSPYSFDGSGKGRSPRAGAGASTGAGAGTVTVAETDTGAETGTGTGAGADTVTVADTGTETRSATAAWVHQLGAVRDAVLALPPIPAALWIGVASMLLGVVAFRTIRFRRLLARARPAPREVVTMVAGAAEALGVRRAPSTLVVDERISPLVWCGRDLLLLLPADLWSQLDEPGRRAVIYHELAHLRRRDHWVSWFGTLVGCLYWWHPVVWWIRRRLREEADLCCDAWVTTLLPGARRAYATALLETKRFTSLEAPAGPAVGLGVTALRARRFARRLTMIMSHQRTPQLTVAGITFAAAVIVIGWLVSPTLACPPDPAEAPKAVQARAPAPRPPKAPRSLLVLPEAPPGAHAPHAPQPSGTTYEQFIRTHAPGDTSLEQRLEQLERRLDRLSEILESRFGGAEAAPHVEYRVAPSPARPTPGELDAARRAYEGALMDVREAPAAPGRVYWKKYELPERKLEALTELMSREDVPILIRPGDEYLEVQGDDQTHRIFRAFCVMIDGEDQVREYELPKGKLEGMIELMRDGDVPILIEIGDDRIGVHGTTLEQAVFAAFCRLIAPERQAQGELELSVIAEMLVATDENDARDHLLRSFEVEHQGVHTHVESLHAELADVHERMAMSEAYYERMLAKAENLEEAGDRLENEADELEDLLEEMEEQEEMAKAASVRAKIAAMLASAERVWAEAEAYEDAAEQHEDEYDALEELADELEEQIEELQELLHELREQMTR